MTDQELELAAARRLRGTGWDGDLDRLRATRAEWVASARMGSGFLPVADGPRWCGDVLPIAAAQAAEAIRRRRERAACADAVTGHRGCFLAQVRMGAMGPCRPLR